MTIDQFVGCVSGLCLSGCGRNRSRSARCLDSVRGGESGAIFEAIIGGEVSLYFAQALRDGTRK
jgi:hypothetical protein